MKTITNDQGTSKELLGIPNLVFNGNICYWTDRNGNKHQLEVTKALTELKDFTSWKHDRAFTHFNKGHNMARHILKQWLENNKKE